MTRNKGLFIFAKCSLFMPKVLLLGCGRKDRLLEKKKGGGGAGGVRGRGYEVSYCSR